MGYYNKTNTGQLLNLINEQSNRAGVGFYHLTQFIFQAVSAFIYLSLAILAAPAFGLTALLSGFCILCLLQILSRYVKRLSIEMVNEGGELAKVFIQIIHGFKYLKSTGQVIKLKDKIYLSIKNLKNCQVKVGIAHGFTQAVREPISVILILSLASYELSKEDGNLSFVLISIVLFYRSVNALLSIQTQWQATLEHIGSLESIQQNLEEIQASSEKHGMIEKNKLNQEIILQGVFYRYHSKSELVLKNINITVKACTLVGFVGPSGSGKTTLVDLLTLIYSPSGGALLIDGLNGRDLDPDNWRSQIGYVSQDSVIFDDSIDNNISLFDESVDSHRVKMAAKMANLHDFIESLPDQYKTMVGDRGVRLSGGQKQRLFIAREICRKPSILILDEATSALDSIAEAEIQKSIEYLKGKLTIIIIAHRLGSVRSADIIHVIHKGILIESGDYKTLSCDKNSLFSELLKGN